MSELLELYASMMGINTQMQKQALDREVAQEMMKTQRIQAAVTFIKQIGKIDILNEAIESSDFTKVDKMVDMYNKISKELPINSFAQLCKAVKSTEVLSEALESGDYTVIDKITDAALRTRGDDPYEDKS